LNETDFKIINTLAILDHLSNKKTYVKKLSTRYSKRKRLLYAIIENDLYALKDSINIIRYVKFCVLPSLYKKHGAIPIKQDVNMSQINLLDITSYIDISDALRKDKIDVNMQII
jgi:hypothetical protein